MTYINQDFVDLRVKLIQYFTDKFYYDLRKSGYTNT